jgi:hypothetical protein
MSLRTKSLTHARTVLEALAGSEMASEPALICLRAELYAVLKDQESCLRALSELRGPASDNVLGNIIRAFPEERTLHDKLRRFTRDGLHHGPLANEAQLEVLLLVKDYAEGAKLFSKARSPDSLRPSVPLIEARAYTSVLCSDLRSDPAGRPASARCVLCGVSLAEGQVSASPADGRARESAAPAGRILT